MVQDAEQTPIATLALTRPHMTPEVKMRLPEIPRLVKTAESKQLHVHGKPYLVRGVELQNSSFSSLEHMSRVWPELRRMNVNTVLGPVAWEVLEPTEGTFDFTLVDGLIQAARDAGLKLVLLWFGAWKNGISTYVPHWVKMTPKRFPRVSIRTKEGTLKVTETLSCIHGETLQADAKAFRALMAHLKEFDAKHSTVVMVQVENEVGILGDSRDRDSRACAVFDAPVPSDLIHFLNQDWTTLNSAIQRKLTKAKRDGLVEGKTWSQTFGDGVYTDELFMAYHYATYVNQVAAIGKQEYPLPLFANFWLNYGEDDQAAKHPVLAGGGNLPGDYPAGGAVSTVLDVWQKFAPSLDFISPDTYLNEYHTVCSTYRHRDQPLFIPEQRRDEYGARRTWVAIGKYLAIGACPFGVDTLTVEECAYTAHYELLAKVEDVVLEAQQRKDAIIGFHFDDKTGPDPDQSAAAYECVMNGFKLTISRAFTTGEQGPGYGIVIAQPESARGAGTAAFLLVGAGFQVVFEAVDESAVYTGLLDVVELDRNADGTWKRMRRLNGDETRSGHQAIMPNLKPDDGGFPIMITIPALTRIAECTVYSI